MRLKAFAQQVQEVRTDAEVPENEQDCACVFAKSFQLSNQQAHAILSGLRQPSDELLAQLSEEFEIPASTWMNGNE